ncbi:autotransporter outer membrane beta-barrel domain-containing protein [Roseibium aggregatum]|uniref:Autotransporter outer membrane beta-barrel domain-containing protein n=1 Tax=Roseibium aggregatum TaxID=187304 RepID=A0A939J3S2_9HYPH|nr:autotransporter outer membrane beta-barrel domain-containing protein [Roseibium aggregatum]MBN9669959.1 autotransporter outer membrane beta-barrel domain-containing protein [Roseibium aggregatum]
MTSGWALAGTPGSYTYSYVAINFMADTTGSYTFGQSSAPIDTIMAVYLNGSFDIDALINPDAYNDDSNSSNICYGIGRCPEVTSTLTAGQSNTLIISTYSSSSTVSLPLGFFANGVGTISFTVAPVAGTTTFEPVSQPGISKEMAAVMDTLNGGGGSVSTSLGNALTSLAAMPDSERAAALSRISPNASIAFSQATSRSLQRNTLRIGDRLVAVRGTPTVNQVSATGYQSASSETSRRVAQSFNALTGNSENEDVAVATHGETAGVATGLRPNSLWGQFYGFKTTQEMEDGYAGYDSFGHSYLVGFDVVPMPDLIVGVAGGYTKTYVDMADYRDGDKSIVDSYQASLYGSYEFANNWIADAIVSYVRHQYDSNRGTTLDTAHADFSANQVGARLDVTKVLETGNEIVFRPKAGIAWSGLYQDGYQETDSALAQYVDSNTTYRFQTNVSLEASKQFAVSERFSVTPSLSAGWTHDFLTDGTDVTARFVGGGDSFTSTGQALAADTFQVRSALELVRDEQLHVDLGATGEFATGYQDYGGQVRVSWKF